MGEDQLSHDHHMTDFKIYLMMESLTINIVPVENFVGVQIFITDASNKERAPVRVDCMKGERRLVVRVDCMKGGEETGC